ncbi:hypothetical protein K8354_16200 [Polaribacter litorisediminis]|uniref:STM3941 family protein n=1 Tax=Polaribacter litorisediminis TaxID=1908341 RepID=UPI001CBE33A1|nr:STM3941 family protein [Polaribacter litorisediminis]UAM97809.1 hypothetical protein K8354_16185 [Polaribacter litorisediminis]UAM97812.1 hypothetical protein K8354_16200 [Polaribacter litorisediminis]
MNKKIEISISKKKVLLNILGSIGFVALGIWMVVSEKESESNQILGILAIIFFGFTLIIGIKKLFEKNSGLIIDSKGITDYTNSNSIGLIEWEDIIDIRIIEIMSIKFILVDLENSEKYIKKAKNSLQSKLMRKNLKDYGSPITLTTTNLNCSFKKLEKLIMNEFERNNNFG